MEWPPVECPKCYHLWNSFPGTINYCNHMGECPMLERLRKMAQVPPINRDPLLQEREKTHGSFYQNANLWRELCEAANKYINQSRFNAVRYLALYMIFLKIARLVQNPNEKDHWADIAGYAKLGEEACD